MARQLRSIVVLTEDLVLVLNIHITAYNLLPMFSWTYRFKLM